MNASSGGNWRGGKKSSPQSQSTAAPSSSRGWKNAKKSPSSSRKKNSKKLSQFFGVGLCLLVLILIAVWIFWPNYQVHTHFVLIDPLQGNDRFPFSAQVKLPESNVDKAGRFTVGKHSRGDSQSLDFFNEEELKTGKNPLRDADVCVIFFRAATIPGSDQSHLVLLKNSTADPEVENQHELLSSLKKKLLQLPERQKILLIVDVNSIGSDWRSGMFGDSTHREFIKWTEEIPNLITILSCDVGEKSWTSGMPGFGGTVFEMILQDAFSLKADQPRSGSQTGDAELTLQEFYEYLSQETNAWVLANRSQEGQHVQIYPPLEKVSLDSKGQPLILMKALPEPILQQPDNNAAKDLVAQLPNLWNQVQTHTGDNAPFSVPVLLAAAQTELFDAEFNLQMGRLDVAKNLLSMSQENFANATQIREDKNDRIELTLARKDQLIEHTEINQWLSTARLIATKNEETPAESSSEILIRNIEAFPYGKETVEKPAPNLLQEIETAQRHMEKTSALMFHDSQTFEPMLKKMQQELLLIEDLLFVNLEQLPGGFAAPDTQTFLREFEMKADLIEEYVLLKLEVENFQLRLFGELPELVIWAAGFNETPYATELLAALQANQPTIPPTRATEADKLHFAVSNCLLATEELLSLYLEQRKQPFQTLSELENALKLLKTKHKASTTIWQNVETLMTQVKSAIPRTGTDRWSQSFNATNLPLFEERTRSDLLESSMLPWSEGESGAPSEKKKNLSTSVAEEQFPNYRDRIVWESAWRLRLQDVMALTSNATQSDASKQLQTMWDAWQLLEESTTAEAVHRELYRLGAMIRNDWELRRNQLTTALAYSGDDIQQYRLRLLRSDLAARFFRADDIDLWRTQREIQTAYERASQVQYCLYLADQAYLSQWVSPSDKPLENGNKWYFQEASSWLQVAAQLVTRDASLSSVQEEITTRQNALMIADKWTTLVQLELPSLQRFEEQQQQIQFTASLQFPESLPESAVSSFALVGAEAGQGGTTILELPRNGIPLPLQKQNQTAELTVNRLFVPKPDDCSSVSLRPQLFYRGRTMLKTPIVINPCPSSQRTWQYLAGRESAEINVKGDDNRPIVFVLDWSFSMNELDANGNPKQRHLAAANAVEQIIEEMPATMRVGLVVFGHSSKQDNAGNPIMNPAFANNFKQFMEVKLKDPLEDVDIIHEIGLLETDRELIKHKLNLLKDVEPYSTTPLGLAITTAAQELSRKTNSGGIVVAITDGAPRDIGNAMDSLPDNPTPAEIDARKELFAKRLAALQRALKPSSISTILFALDFGAADLTTLNCIFGNGGNQGPCAFMGNASSLQIPIVRASGEGDSDGGTLRDVIDAQIEPRPFQVLLANGEPVAEEPLKDATILVQPDKTYRVRFGDIDIKDLHLSAGDVVTLEMNWSKGRFDVKRDFNSHKSASISNTLMNQLDVPDTLRVNKVKRPSINSDPDFYESIEVDVMLDHNRSFRPVQKPEEIWFQISAVADANFHPDAVDQEYTSKFGAPGWKLKLSPWPRNRVLSLDAFWKMSRTTPDHLITVAQLGAADSRDKAILLGGNDKPFPSFKIWHKSRKENGRLIYEVRIEPVDKLHFISLSDLTVEIGETSILNESNSFRPDSATHLKTIVNSGVIVHSFEYAVDDIDLGGKVIAITTRKSREEGSLHLRAPIEVLD